MDALEIKAFLLKHRAWVCGGIAFIIPLIPVIYVYLTGGG